MSSIPKNIHLLLPCEQEARKREKFRNYVSHCIAGKRFPKELYATVGKEVTPGVTVKMSDCDYTATETGNFVRTEIPATEKSLSRSQLYVPARPRKNDKYGNMRLTGA